MGFFTGKLTEQGYQRSILEGLLLPKVSGNTINGLGEETPRQPSKVYHFATQTTKFPFFWVNILFFIKSSFPKHYRQLLQRAVDGHKAAAEIKPAAKLCTDKSAEQWSREIKAFALANGAELVGITETDPLWLYEGAASPGKWLIILGFVMDYAELKKVPEIEGASEIMRVYGNCGETAAKLVDWIRSEGQQAKGGALTPTGLNVIPAALEAGLGELGKHGSLINKQFGAPLRLAYVAVDFPLVEDQPDPFYLDDFCTGCQVCTKACPPKAIFNEKQMVRGTEKWYVDFDKCLPYFNDTLGCGICLAVCPWSLPDRAPIITNKLQRRRDRAKERATTP